MTQKIGVVGAGAIGSYVAAKLIGAGYTTSVVARGAQLEAIRKNGITVLRPPENLTVQVLASDDASVHGPQDVVIVAVKGPSLTAAIPAILPLLGPQTPIVFMLNGIPWWYFYAHGGVHDGRQLDCLDPGGGIWSSLGPERAIGCTVQLSSRIRESGVVEVEAAPNRLMIGEPSGRATERMRRVGDILRAGGFDVGESSRIRDEVWTKLRTNISTGPMCVLSQASLAEVYRDDSCSEACRRSADELSQIAEAHGCKLSAFDFDAFLSHIRGSCHKPSILQDLETGRMMEIDAIYELPLQMARAAGVPVPTLELLVNLTKIRARQANLYAR